MKTFTPVTIRIQTITRSLGQGPLQDALCQVATMLGRHIALAVFFVFPLLLASAAVATPILGNYPDTSLALITDTSATTGTANPVPLINQPLIPDAIAPGGPGFTLTVNGTGFVSGSVVNWDRSPRATTFVSVSQLTTSIMASDIAGASTASVTVVNPSPGGGISNVEFFPITLASSSILLSKSDYATAAGPAGVGVGDFNGDGKLDLAVTDNYAAVVSILLGNGDGTFQALVNYPTGNLPGYVVVGDFNEDGKLDLAINSQGSNELSVLLGNGDGTFQPAANYAAGIGDGALTLGDFNRDGHLDLASTSLHHNTVSILLGNGDGTFQSQVVYATGLGPYGIAVGDFNGDGKQDLAIANINSNAVSIFLGNGDGTFQPHVEYATGLGANWVSVADLNADGFLDLIVPNIVSSTVSILLGNGDGTFEAHADYAVPSGANSSLVADFNGDGKLDLAVTPRNFSDVVSILFGNGDGTFEAPVDFATGSDPLGLAAGDFNDDGRLDLAVANLSGNTVSVLLQTTVATKVGGRGSLDNQGNEVSFKFHATRVDESTIPGRFSFCDSTAGVCITNARIRDLSFTGNTAEFSGAGRLEDGNRVTFSVNVTDNGWPGTSDIISITLSNGYFVSGNLTSGNIRIY